VRELPEAAADSAKQVTEVLKEQTPGSAVGEAVKGATPGAARLKGGDANLFVPETKASDTGGNRGGGSNPLSDTISSVGKNFGDAVSSAVKSVTGGGDK
jgi:hypothetical protein